MAVHSASEDARERAYARPSTSLVLLKNKTWMPAPSAGMTIQLKPQRAGLAGGSGISFSPMTARRRLG